nr:reverse transcriptase domain-containing protein [Tanacetum cinerariifolium]
MIEGKPFNMKHKLNEYCHIKPIKKNKRGLAPDRNMTACKETEELTKARILRKAKHQTWVVNPVMVKKDIEDGEKETPVDFFVEIPSEDNERKEKPKEVPNSSSKWRLYTDGASNSDGSGAGLMLINPEGKEYTYALRFEFESTNNEAEYKALLAEDTKEARKIRIWAAQYKLIRILVQKILLHAMDLLRGPTTN